MFNTYGDQGGHWTAGDETMSAKLPDGRVAWFFGDTMMGKVNADRTRPPGQPMINNSVVIQDGTTLTRTLHGGSADDPQSYVGADTKTEENELGWWPGESRQLDANTLEVFYTHVKRGTDGGVLSYVTAERAIVRFDLPGMTVRERVKLKWSADPADPKYVPLQIGWGAALVDGTDGKTYIYGTHRVGEVDSLYVARTPKGALADTSQWEYLTSNQAAAKQWSSAEKDARPIMTGIGAGFSVKKVGDQYALVTMDTSEIFSNEVVAYFAKDPAGPFTHQTSLYSAPEPAAHPGAWVYNARLHPEQTTADGTMVVSYNVGSFTPGACDADVHLCRPRFFTAKLQPPADGQLLPNAPQNVVAATTGAAKVTLSWEPNPSTATGLKYRVYQRNRIDGASQFTRAHQAVTARSVQIDISRSGTYEFRVAAENSVGEGPQSVTAEVPVYFKSPATAPANLVATAGDDLSAKLKWDPVPADGLVTYNVYQRNVTAGETSFRLNGAAYFDGATAVVRDLVQDSTYEFRVAAKNSSGEGPHSAPAQVTARGAAPPAPPGLTATPNEDGTIQLNWKQSTPDAWYWVYTKDVTDDPDLTTGFTQQAYPVSNGTTFTAGYLTTGNKYAFYVTAIGKYGTDSPPSNIAQAVSRIAPPPAPSNLTASPNDDGTIRLSWASSGPEIWYYVHSRNVSKNEQTFTRSQYPISDGTTFTAGYLTNGDTYEFYVTAIGLGDTVSAPSNKVQQKAVIAPPPAPAKLTASSNNDGTIALRWQSSGPDIWYYVWSKESTATAYTRSQYPVSDGTSFTAGYLSVGKSYDFYVTAIGSGGTLSAPSNVARAKSYVPPPAAPKNLKAVARNGEVDLSWSSVGAGVWYYVYSRNVSKSQGFTRSQYPISNGTTFTAGYLTNGDTYEFYVTAIGEWETESAPSETVQAEPNMPPPSAPSNVTAKPRTDGTIDVSWNNQGSGVGYWLYTKDITDDASLSGGFSRSKYPIMNGSSINAGFLINKHKYAFYVTAFNDGGVSGRSAIVTATSLIPPPPAPNLSAKSNKDGTITLNWNSVGSGLWYWVYTKDPGSSEFKRSKYPVSKGTTFTAGYLKIGQSYSFRVTTIGPGGESAYSNTVTATSTVPPPTNLVARYNDWNAVMLDWDSQDPDAWFWVYVRDTRTSVWKRQGWPVSGRTWQIVSPLEGGVTYEFQVRQAANGGETAPSNTARFTMYPPPDSACASVTTSSINDPTNRPPAKIKQIQRYDVTGTNCGRREGNTVTLNASWDSKGNQVRMAVFLPSLIDCNTGQQVGRPKMEYYSPPGITSDRVTATYTINPNHRYRTVIAGQGEIMVKWGTGLITAHFFPTGKDGIIPFLAYSRCF
jgi:hypothetical protein